MKPFQIQGEVFQRNRKKSCMYDFTKGRMRRGVEVERSILLWLDSSFKFSIKIKRNEQK